MAKIKHTRNENGQNFTHQNKTTRFWRKKTKINLHQKFPIYGNNKCILMSTLLFFGIIACNKTNKLLYLGQINKNFLLSSNGSLQLGQSVLFDKNH